MPHDELGKKSSGHGASPTYTDDERELLVALEALRVQTKAQLNRLPTELEKAAVVLQVADAQAARQHLAALAGSGTVDPAAELGWARTILELAQMLGYRRLSPAEAAAYDRKARRRKPR